MDTPARRRLNMSDNKGAHECQCRRHALHGSVADPACQDCDGTGYTNSPDAKKDWTKDPEPDMDF